MRLVLIEWEDSHVDGVRHTLTGEIEDRALVCRSCRGRARRGTSVAASAHEARAARANEASSYVLIRSCRLPLAMRSVASRRLPCVLVTITDCRGAAVDCRRRSCVLILETIPWRRRTAGRDCTEIYRDRGITSAS